MGKHDGFSSSKGNAIDTVYRGGRPKGLPRYGGRPKGYVVPDRWWSVPRAWDGETCFILAGGPSLRNREFQCLDAVRGRARCIAINSSYQLAPWADVLYWSDMAWWRAWQGDVVENFTGYTVTIDHPKLSWAKSLHDLGQVGLSADPTGIYRGNNSGYAAINLAYLFGVKRICLLGYDMRAVDGRTHWHRGHEWLRETPDQADRKLVNGFLPLFQYLVKPLQEAGVEVYNCTPGSMLHCWQFRPWGWCLRQAIQEREAKSGASSQNEPLRWIPATVGL